MIKPQRIASELTHSKSCIILRCYFSITYRRSSSHYYFVKQARLNYPCDKKILPTTSKCYACYHVVGNEMFPCSKRACSGSTYIKIGTIQRRLAWPLRKDDTQIREAFQIFAFVLMKYTSIPFVHAKKSSKEKQKH